MRVYGLWHGGHGSYAQPDVRLDVESFPSIQAARDRFADRVQSSGAFPEPFEFVNRDPEEVRIPATDDSQWLHLFFALPESGSLDGCSPDRVLTVGPRGGIVED